MYENEYMYAIERDPAYLAHYGIKGMKWGVRKAIERGNDRALGRQYRKAQKKLAKLEKRAANGAKYARRAARLGAGAALAGGAAALGTSGISQVIGKGGFAAGKAMRGVGEGMRGAGNQIARFGARTKNKRLAQLGIGTSTAGRGLRNLSNELIRNSGRAGVAVSKWGKSTSLSKGLSRAGISAVQAADGAPNLAKKLSRRAGEAMNRTGNKMVRSGVTNNTIARIGAGAIGAGLAGAAGYNAYRAATTKRAAKKAAQFRSEMNKAFKGTKYANGGGNRQGGKRRRRG